MTAIPQPNSTRMVSERILSPLQQVARRQWSVLAARGIILTLLGGLTLILVAAPAALADEGVGLAGPTTDKTVTFFCFGVIFFFAALVIVLSLIQGRLERRKEQRKADLARFN